MSTTASEEKGISSSSDVKINAQHTTIIDSETSGLEESLELTPQELRRLKRIVDWRILPYISLLYLLSPFDHLDRRNSSRSHGLVGSLTCRFFGPRKFY